MNIIEMCCEYNYNPTKRISTCSKSHRANLECHFKREDCLDYYPTEETVESRQRYEEFVECWRV